MNRVRGDVVVLGAKGKLRTLYWNASRVSF